MHSWALLVLSPHPACWLPPVARWRCPGENKRNRVAEPWLCLWFPSLSKRWFSEAREEHLFFKPWWNTPWETQVRAETCSRRCISAALFGMWKILALLPSKEGRGTTQKMQDKGRKKKKRKAGISVWLHFPKAHPQVYFQPSFLNVTFDSCSYLLCAHLLRVGIWGS